MIKQIYSLDYDYNGRLSSIIIALLVANETQRTLHEVLYIKYISCMDGILTHSLKMRDDNPNEFLFAKLDKNSKSR